MRVWFTEGSPEEQFLIVNDIVDSYVKSQQEIFRNALEGLGEEKRAFKAMKEREGIRVTKEK